MTASSSASSSRSAKAAPAPSSAADELDAHLVSLLHAGDAYAASQKAAAAHLASAFLSLSRARMHLGALGASSLLGADGADARLKAGVRCRVDDSGRMSIVRGGTSASEKRPVALSEEKPVAPEGLRRRQRADAVLSEKENAASSLPEEEEASAGGALEADRNEKEDGKKSDAPPSKPKRPPQAPDPLYQFSALPPPALRSAQKSFVAALDELLGARSGAQGAWQSVQHLAQLEYDIADARRRAGEEATATQ